MTRLLLGPKFSLGRRFYLLLAGESLSTTSGALIEFALGIWIYSHSGSVTDFAGAVLAITWPPVLILPLAGALADRVDRKYLIAGSDAMLALILALLGWMIWSNRLELIYLYVFNCVASIVAGMRQPAYQAVVAAIVPPDEYVRAAGLTGLSANVSSMLAPLAAGLLMGAAGLDVVIVVSLLAFVLGALMVLRALRNVPRIAVSAGETARSVTSDVFRNLGAGFAFFREDRLMLWLLAYVMVQSSLLALSSLMITPLVLASHTQQQLGWIYSCGALGGLAGGLLIVVMGTPRRTMLTVAGFDAVLSLSVIGIGATVATPWYCVFAFAALAAAAVAEGCVRAMWMRKVPVRYHGSVFSLVAMFMLATVSATLLGGGLLVDHLLEPALAASGSLSGTMGILLGTGKGRGIALLFVISGTLGVAVCTAALASKRMRRLDTIVHDGAREARDALRDPYCRLE